MWPDAHAFHREYHEALGSPFFPEARGLAALRTLKTARAERVCYLDIETTGLSMSPLFLVGLMYTVDGRLMMDQLFARDYSEEGVVLRFLADMMPRFEILVTFNGITFDVPFIKERMTIHRLAFRRRRRFTSTSCRSRAASWARGRRTTGFRRSRRTSARGSGSATSTAPTFRRRITISFEPADAKDVANIIHHNRLDLVTMLQLVTIFLSVES